ncbi:hypothetical protein [Virgisporangium aliadipatigenens]|nr:hypothetical protein [Virgisporangium aliadipatigenens]
MAVLLIVAIGFVVVAAMSDNERPPNKADPLDEARALDPCLVGNWKQEEWHADVDVGALTQRPDIGTVWMSGNGRFWTIFPSGTAMDGNIVVNYHGTSADGRTIRLSYSGSARYKMTTTNNKINLAGLDSTVDLTIYVNDTEIHSRQLSAENRDNIPYSCRGDTWEVTGPGPNDRARYTRQ